MRIALNASILRAPRTGIGHYVAELFSALRNLGGIDLELFDGWSWQEGLPSASLPGYSKLSGAVKLLLPNAYQLRRLMQQHRFDRGARRVSPALYHEPSLWPFDFDGPMIMTVHDLAHVHYPQTQPVDRLREIERQVNGGLERASKILVDSQFIASEVVRHYSVSADKVVVAPLGHSRRFYPRSFEQLNVPLAEHAVRPREYLLCIGTVEPRKNLQLVIDGYLALPEALRRQYPLLIAGMPGWRNEQLQGSLQRALASGQVRLLGYLQDNALAELLAGARLLLFPSLYEGFGLPVLEAMASGTPVILSRRAALPEVAGDAGLYIDPEDIHGCASALQNLLEDEAAWQARRTAGLLRAQDFSWARCAQITANTYRELVGS
ncbi:glycosyltransferase family 4 protein [Pseudomonas sp. PDM15]|uniref:glycosyltransferase family 4 protein n=1 Tax=Pseudomonas sp. PDM15 TaxID=2769303 RepID=UPI00177B5A0D|nr:glycosyltransferase family 1 protein [Pseudomonas sp. PDM15]MBD9426159.1 glycosyltransferase family 4 protein [Pseudomonas sp. PDM15]